MTTESAPTDATVTTASTDPMSVAVEKTATLATPDAAQITADAGTPAPEGDKPKDAEPAPDGNPTDTAEVTAYQDFNVPEGQTLIPEVLEKFKSAALDAKLTQEQAQHLVDMGAEMSAQITQQAWDAHNARIAEWGEQAKADKEFGGDKLNENLALASKAMTAFATPELKQVLDQTGLGNHPELIRAFVRIGKQISEDSLVPGGSMPSGDSRSIAERLYPNS